MFKWNGMWQYLPHNFNSGRAFHLALLPHWIIPVQVEEQNHNSRNLIQVFGHPQRLEYAFWYVPLVWRPLQLKSLKQNDLKILKSLTDKHMLHADTLVTETLSNVMSPAQHAAQLTSRLIDNNQCDCAAWVTCHILNWKVQTVMWVFRTHHEINQIQSHSVAKMMLRLSIAFNALQH